MARKSRIKPSSWIKKDEMGLYSAFFPSTENSYDFLRRNDGRPYAPKMGKAPLGCIVEPFGGFWNEHCGWYEAILNPFPAERLLNVPVATMELDNVWHNFLQAFPDYFGDAADEEPAAITMTQAERRQFFAMMAAKIEGQSCN